MKKVLLTAIGYNDPYTKVSYGEDVYYNDGPIFQILRKYHTEKEPIEAIYIYFSYDMAIEETRTSALRLALKHFDPQGKIKINVFPKNILEDTKKKREEIKHFLENEGLSGEELKRETEKKLMEEKGIGRVDVNKFGSFYPEIQTILKELALLSISSPFEVLVNVTSGTPAMKDDLNLMAITNKNNLRFKMIQVSNPKRNFKESVVKKNPYMDDNITDEQIIEDLDHVDEVEKGEDRTSAEEMTNIKRLLLAESVEDLFTKYDYAGVYEAIKKANDEGILGNETILHYAENLYYRYIGNEDLAKKAASKLPIDVYPIKNDDSTNNNYELVIENYNILKIKSKRKEINDWLLFIQALVEDLYKKILYKLTDGFDVEEIIKRDKPNRNMASLKIFENKCGKKYGNTSLKNKIFTKRDGKGLDDYVSITSSLLKYINTSILKENEFAKDMKFYDKNNLKKNIYDIDKLRSYRNESAHTIELVTEDILIKGTEEQYIISKSEKIVGEIVAFCLPKEKRNKLDSACHIYETIQGQITSLLDEEILKRGE